MSPPCQPFTRQGLHKDLEDPRTQPLTRILSLIPEINSLKYILVENVKGFETSAARDSLVKVLNEQGFVFQEFLICSKQLEIPNSRLRYYLIGKLSTGKTYVKEVISILYASCFILEPGLAFPHKSDLWTDIEELTNLLRLPAAKPVLKCYLDPNPSEELFLDAKTLSKRAELLDIVNPNSRKSCCFTKAYGRYAEGTGKNCLGYFFP